MSSIEYSLKQVESAIKGLRAALQAEKVISSPAQFQNQQDELSVEELLIQSSIRLWKGVLVRFLKILILIVKYNQTAKGFKPYGELSPVGLTELYVSFLIV